MPKHSPEILDTLLSKGLVWRGKAALTVHDSVISTRFDSLDQALNGGWPSALGIEVCVPTFAVEWYLLAKQISHVTQTGQIAVLINPPYELMALRLMQDNIALSNLWLIKPMNNADFVAASVECLRTHSCGIVAAWEPKALSFVQLRKCMLACADHAGLFFLMRNAFARRNASPAGLRIMLKPQAQQVAVEIFKQKGLMANKTVNIDVPQNVLPNTPTHLLGAANKNRSMNKNQPANLLNFRRNTKGQMNPSLGS